MSALTDVKPSVVDRPTVGRSSRTPPGALLMGAAVATLAAGLYVAALLHYPRKMTLQGFDLGVYRMGGLLARLDPSHLYLWQLRPDIRFTYTPFAAFAFTPLSTQPLSTLMDLAVPLSLLALVATISIAFRELGWRGRLRVAGTLLVAGIALWSQPVQRALYLGQIELVLMGLVVWDLCQPDRRAWKGAATGIAAAVKLVPLIFIAYLVVTRRLRQAAVASGVFAATVLIGFIALPTASAKWWLQGYFLEAGRTGFVAGRPNQSLRGLITRLAGSVAAGLPLWLLAACLVGVVGLAIARRLDLGGHRLEGLLTVALTALLISPISWDHHWVWIAPGLAALVVAGARSRRRLVAGAYGLAALLLIGAFAAWPTFWARTPKLLHGGLIKVAPLTLFHRHPHRPWFAAEYHWHGVQLVAGNLYVLAGCIVFLILAIATFGPGSWHSRRFNMTSRRYRLRWPAAARSLTQPPGP